MPNELSELAKKYRQQLITQSSHLGPGQRQVSPEEQLRAVWAAGPSAWGEGPGDRLATAVDASPILGRLRNAVVGFGAGAALSGFNPVGGLLGLAASQLAGVNPEIDRMMEAFGPGLPLGAMAIPSKLGKLGKLAKAAEATGKVANKMFSEDELWFQLMPKLEKAAAHYARDFQRTLGDAGADDAASKASMAVLEHLRTKGVPEGVDVDKWINKAVHNKVYDFARPQAALAKNVDSIDKTTQTARGAVADFEIATPDLNPEQVLASKQTGVSLEDLAAPEGPMDLQQFIAALPGEQKLSKIEKKIASKLADGQSQRAIATALGVRPLMVVAVRKKLSGFENLTPPERLRREGWGNQAIVEAVDRAALGYGQKDYGNLSRIGKDWLANNIPVSELKKKYGVTTKTFDEWLGTQGLSREELAKMPSAKTAELRDRYANSQTNFDRRLSMLVNDVRQVLEHEKTIRLRNQAFDKWLQQNGVAREDFENMSEVVKERVRKQFEAAVR